MSRTKIDEHQRQGRYRRWIELAPVQSKVWRYARDVLLEDRYSLEEICDALHARAIRGGAARRSFGFCPMVTEVLQIDLIGGLS